MNDRQCPRCGSDVLYGAVDGWPDVSLSRTPITRDSALLAFERGILVAACRRLRGSKEILSQFWHPRWSPKGWAILIQHDCREWK